MKAGRITSDLGLSISSTAPTEPRHGGHEDTLRLTAYLDNSTGVEGTARFNQEGTEVDQYTRYSRWRFAFSILARMRSKNPMSKPRPNDLGNNEMEKQRKPATADSMGDAKLLCGMR